MAVFSFIPRCSTFTKFTYSFPNFGRLPAAIALLDEVAWPRADGTAIPLAEFNRWLVAIPADRRAVAQRTVMVERRADDTQKQMQEFQ